jgi:hypothetical protein
LVLGLKSGYRLRAVIRKPEQIEQLKAHALVKPYLANLEFVVVPNLAKKGAFDQVLDGVSDVIHLASPLAVEVRL